MRFQSKTMGLTRATAASALIAFLAGGCALFGPKTDVASYQTDDGAIVVETTKLTATVTAVDQRNRTVTLDPKYGAKQVLKASPDMSNFNQFRVGDVVRAEIIEEMAVSLISGGAAESAGALDGVSLAPLGEKPAITVVSRGSSPQTSSRSTRTPTA